MRLGCLVILRSFGCAARVAVGPSVDTRGGAGAVLTATMTFAAARGRVNAGPSVGVEPAGSSGQPFGALGFALGADVSVLVRDEKIAISTGARLVTAMGFVPWGYLGRAIVSLDVTREIRRIETPLRKMRHLGVGLEGGPQWGSEVPTSGVVSLLLIARFYWPED